MKRLEIDSPASFSYAGEPIIPVNEKAAGWYDLAALSISHYYLANLL